jgi:hypothetical protein
VLGDLARLVLVQVGQLDLDQCIGLVMYLVPLSNHLLDHHPEHNCIKLYTTTCVG